MTTIALIGYGEIGRILAEDLLKLGKRVAAFDVKLTDARGDALRVHAREHGVELVESHAQVAFMADLADEAAFGTRGAPGFARSADWRVEADHILDRARVVNNADKERA